MRKRNKLKNNGKNITLVESTFCTVRPAAEEDSLDE